MKEGWISFHFWVNLLCWARKFIVCVCVCVCVCERERVSAWRSVIWLFTPSWAQLWSCCVWWEISADLIWHRRLLHLFKLMRFNRKKTTRQDNALLNALHPAVCRTYVLLRASLGWNYNRGVNGVSQGWSGAALDYEGPFQRSSCLERIDDILRD